MPSMSFLQRAKEAAESAAEGAKKVAGDAAGAAGQVASQAGQVASQATRSAQDPETQAKLNKRGREAVGLARRGVTTVVERIDPGTLAEVIIKATALQEMTNSALRQKRSPYRISEVVISASIPPGVSFAIGRGDDVLDEIPTGDISSAQLVEQLADPGESVVTLAGLKFDEAELEAAREELVSDEAARD
jgi:hypothetical protein